MRVGLAQMNSVLGDVESNIARMRAIVDEAAPRNVDLLVFPELSITGYSLGQVSEEVSLPLSDPRLQTMIDKARDLSIVFGLHEEGGLRTYNSAVYCENGKLVHVHRKLYLPTYSAFEERKHFSPGQQMRAFPTRWGQMAILICNDAWQPVLASIAVQDGAEVLIIPTNSACELFPGALDNKDYWHDITRFYARMFESYVIFVNRVGTENSFEFWGGSHVVDPAGRIVAQAATADEQLITVDIDLSEVRRWRRKIPLVKEARLALLCREFERLAQNGGDL